MNVPNFGGHLGGDGVEATPVFPDEFGRVDETRFVDRRRRRSRRVFGQKGRRIFLSIFSVAAAAPPEAAANQGSMLKTFFSSSRMKTPNKLERLSSHVWERPGQCYKTV